MKEISVAEFIELVGCAFRNGRQEFYRLRGQNIIPSMHYEGCMLWRYDCGKSVSVTTIFLSLDHANEGPPVLFETLITGGLLDGRISRYITFRSAMRGHANTMMVVALLRFIPVKLQNILRAIWLGQNHETV